MSAPTLLSLPAYYCRNNNVKTSVRVGENLGQFSDCAEFLANLAIQLGKRMKGCTHLREQATSDGASQIVSEFAAEERLLEGCTVGGDVEGKAEEGGEQEGVEVEGVEVEECSEEGRGLEGR